MGNSRAHVESTGVMLGKVRIDTNGSAIAKRWKIYLDDADISRFVKGINFSVTVGDIPRVSLEIVGQLIMPDDLRAIIETYSLESDEDVKTN